MLTISGKTLICGVIGDPIEHTMSPVMHNAAFEHLGIDYAYLPFQVKREDLGQAIAGMRALNIRGLNVTIPHKVAIVPFMDKLDPLAAKIGAINTIINNKGGLTGYNTDATGFLRAINEKGIPVAGRNVALLGAGGAARALAFILAENGAHLVIFNRTLNTARECAANIQEVFHQEAAALELNEANLKATLGQVNIIVNTTSVGMTPDVNGTPVDASLLRPGMVVVDIVYNPLKTRLLTEAERAGATIVDGLDMFVWQGALALEIWTGQKAPAHIMRQRVIQALRL